ncbi:MAG: ABC transporter ATP-binding protein [Ilumatobacteraceae bacterium]
MSVESTKPVLSVRDLQVTVPVNGQDELTVRNVSFDLLPAQRLGLVGESGSGKSLTALSLMGMLSPAVKIQGGEIMLNGRDLVGLPPREMRSVRGREIAMIYQNPMAALNPVQRIGTQLVEGIRLHQTISKAAARRRAIELLGDVGIPNPGRRIDAFPHELSGGMRQRVVIAMALSSEPDVIVADEPTTSLDVTTQARVLTLLRELVTTHDTAVILISHDLEVAASFSDEIVVMYAGRIVERSTSEELFAEPQHPYTRALLDSSCVLSTDIDKPIPVIPGQPPAPGKFPEGCAFRLRCSRAEARCATIDPELVGPRHRAVACHVPYPAEDPTAGSQ